MSGDLLETLRGLEKSRVKRTVDSRIQEFRVCGRKTAKEIFKELCFCILTANYSAGRAIEIQANVGDGFINLPEKTLALKLKKLGYRYPNTRAKYVVEARKHVGSLKEVLRSLEGQQLRDWFVLNVKGLGYKEASHFLRNIGYSDYAILDFHIIDALAEYGLIERPKSLTKKKYLEIEGVLRKLAGKLNLTLAELDLYLWYTETGKVLK